MQARAERYRWQLYNINILLFIMYHYTFVYISNIIYIINIYIIHIRIGIPCIYYNHNYHVYTR